MGRAKRINNLFKKVTGCKGSKIKRINNNLKGKIMNYNIIYAGNFSDIEKIRENAKNDILRRSQVDPWDNYVHGQFAILGDDAIKMFCQKYGYNFKEWDEIKTDGKTRAKLVPFITPSYYYDARDDRGGITNIYTHSKVGVLVEFDGVLLTSHIWNVKGGSRTFYLFNDDTDYNNYLPYNWEKENPKPNRVGTLTDKKVSAWVEWLKAKKRAALDEKEKRENSAGAFLNKIRQIDTTKCKEFRIGEKSGYLVRNGLKYSYEISESGYISEKLAVHYSTGSTMETFLKMSEGNF